MWPRNTNNERVPGGGVLHNTKDMEAAKDNFKAQDTFYESSAHDSGCISSDNLAFSSSSMSENSLLCLSERTSRGTTDRDNDKDHPASNTCDSGIGLSGLDSTSSSNLDSGVLSSEFSGLNITSTPTATSFTATKSDSAFPCEPSKPLQTEDYRTNYIPKELELLLKDVFAKDGYGNTNLHVAVSQGFVEVIYKITKIIYHQALMDVTNKKGHSPLHVAVSVAKGNCEVIRHLVVCGCSPVLRDKEGDTPLHIACRNGDFQAVSELTRSVNIQELRQARLRYTPSLRPGLLAADLINYNGETCMHIAAVGGYREILYHLSLCGANIDAKEGRSGRTALHFVVEWHSLDLISFLVTNCKASLDVENFSGFTPYHLALINGETKKAALLLKLGADETPLQESDEDDDDYLDDDDVSSLGAVGQNCFQPMDDLRIGGVAVTGAGPVPVPPCAPFNADMCF